MNAVLLLLRPNNAQWEQDVWPEARGTTTAGLVTQADVWKLRRIFREMFARNLICSWGETHQEAQLYRSLLNIRLHLSHWHCWCVSHVVSWFLTLPEYKWKYPCLANEVCLFNQGYLLIFISYYQFGWFLTSNYHKEREVSNLFCKEVWILESFRSVWLEACHVRALQRLRKVTWKNNESCWGSWKLTGKTVLELWGQAQSEWVCEGLHNVQSVQLWSPWEFRGCRYEARGSLCLQATWETQGRASCYKVIKQYPNPACSVLLLEP